MSAFQTILASVLAITLLSGGGAVVLALSAADSSQARKALIEKLLHIALLGAGAIIALLGRISVGS